MNSPPSVSISQVYGSDDDRAASLRTFEDGLLWTSNSTANSGEYLPLNTAMVPNENPDEEQVPDEILFVAGDTRVNEQIGLIAIHTLFVREHNRIAALLKVRAHTYIHSRTHARNKRHRAPLSLVLALLCSAFQDANSSMSDEELYQGARKIVGAYIQTITYNEWLPALMGQDALEPYAG